jgi:acetyl-CoA/propionyl-CoA carboxylase biotin carboxyl carrier protein
MFSKILVLNRGEIAVRIIRTCKEMGIKTISVYANGDENAQYVKLSDESYALDGTTAAESFLDTEKILEVIERSKPDALHPGYGFYSENADFVKTVEEKGIVWIGPSSKAIELMGDKLSARKIAIQGKVPIVPGDSNAIKTPDEVIKFGKKAGWPIAIKAAFGGGGRGMKVVYSEDEAEEAYDSATREAMSYFGNSSVYVEKYLVKPRHVEVQIFGDSKGNYVWLGTRDCSVQRRYQKLIEEAPAPFMSKETEQALGEASINAAKACNYTNAGTVEFLFIDKTRSSSKKDEFYFLEMNTRLQVEHCVSEEITRIDFVKEQINIAAGKELSFTQSAYKPISHSIEIRINAENAKIGFVPTPGRINKFSMAQGPGIRYDGGYESGDAISQNFDNLVGKLIATAPTREEAIKKLIRAIDEVTITGIETTIEAQKLMLQSKAFQTGEHHTKWVEDELDLSSLEDLPAQELAKDDDESSKVKKTVVTEVNGKRFEVNVWVDENDLLQKSGTKKKSKRKAVSSGGSSSGNDSALLAPMQGTIVEIKVKAGESFAQGDVLCVLEAMKMENQLRATKDGKIKEVKVSKGDGVGSGDELISFE